MSHLRRVAEDMQAELVRLISVAERNEEETRLTLQQNTEMRLTLQQQLIELKGEMRANGWLP